MNEELSFANPKIKRLRRLIGRRSSRYEERRFVVHGAVAIGEAVAAGFVPDVEFTAVGTDPVSSAEHHVLASGVLERVADTASPQPNIAVFEMPMPADDLLEQEAFVVVLDRVNDPGNLGTILRSAEAAGVDAVVLTPGSVDPYHPKAVRAAAGSLFLIPVIDADLSTVAAAGYRMVGTSSHAGEAHTGTDWSGRVAVVMGSEAHGLDEHAPIDVWTRIDHRGRVESLNLAMATTVLVFEAMRHRGN